MNNPTPVAAVSGDYSVIQFSSEDYAPRERVGVMRETYGRTLQRVDIEPLATEPFHIEATLRRMPGLAMISCCRSAAIYRRRRELIDHDDVGVTVGLTSSYEAHHLGRTLVMNRGDGVVMAGSEPAFLQVPKYGQYVSLRLPVRAMSHRVADLNSAYGKAIRADTPALRLLIRYIGMLEEADGFATPDLRCHAVAHIHDLVVTALGATKDGAEIAKNGGIRAAQFREIKEDIAARFDQPDLSAAAVAARHGVTPRHLQSLFEGEGTTFTEYLLAQRLARAYRTLADPRYADYKISTLAHDAGFGDLSYFNRTFRRRYGIAPSDVRSGAKRTECA